MAALTVSNSIFQNCGLDAKIEITGRPFLDALISVYENKGTHQVVKNRILDLMETWTQSVVNESALSYVG